MLAQRSIDGDKDKELWSVGAFNADGFKEILLVGKYYNIEVKTTRYDAGFAGIFLGIKKIILIFFQLYRVGFTRQQMRAQCFRLRCTKYQYL